MGAVSVPEEQPAPTLSPESRPVMPEVLGLLDALGLVEGHPLSVLLRERQAKGLATYGTQLHSHNGRDAMRDCAEELADAVVYAMQVGLERARDGQPRPPAWFARLLRLAGDAAQAAAYGEGG